MPSFVRLTGAFLIAGLALAVAPQGAEAQLGGLLKKKIADKAAERAADKAAERMGVEQAGGLRVATVEFNESVLEITGVRVDAFLKVEQVPAAAKKDYPAWAAEQERTLKQRAARYEADRKEYDRRRAEHESRQATYETAARAYSECQGKAMAQLPQASANPAMTTMMERMAALPEAEREAFSRRMETRQQRMQLANESGKMQLFAAIRDSVDADMKKTLGVGLAEMEAAGAQSAGRYQQMQSAQTKCGAAPAEPPSFTLEAPTEAGEVMGEEQYVALRVAQAITAAGMDQNSYAVLRERLEAFASGKDAKSGSGIYTESEIAVLEARYDEVKPVLQARKRFRF